MSPASCKRVSGALEVPGPRRSRLPGAGARTSSRRGEIHADGIEAALQHMPADARVVVTLDCDGLDPSAMPGVAGRTPGGLTYQQAIGLIEG